MSDNEEFQKNAAGRAALGGLGERPVVHAGEVAASLFNDLGLAFRRIQAADAFEARVMAAAKSPRDWLLLRDELNPAKPPVEPEETP